MQLFNQSCFIVFLRLTHPQSSLRLRATLPCFPPSHHIPCPRTGERHREMTGDESVPKVMLWGISEWKNFAPMQRLVFFKNMEVGHPYCKIKCRKPNWFMKGEERRPPPPLPPIKSLSWVVTFLCFNFKNTHLVDNKVLESYQHYFTAPKVPTLVVQCNKRNSTKVTPDLLFLFWYM